MSIKVGDKLPSVKLKRLGAEGMEEVDTANLFAGKKVVLFGVPGAYTPTCHKDHLPGFVARADAIRAKGIDDIICVAGNDPFVFKAWGQAHNVAGKVTMLPDGNAEFIRALGLDFDGSGAGLGTRCKRFSLTAEDGVVKSLEVEDKPGDLSVTSADSCLTKLG